VKECPSGFPADLPPAVRNRPGVVVAKFDMNQESSKSRSRAGRSRHCHSAPGPGCAPLTVSGISLVLNLMGPPPRTAHDPFCRSEILTLSHCFEPVARTPPRPYRPTQRILTFSHCFGSGSQALSQASSPRTTTLTFSHYFASAASASSQAIRPGTQRFSSFLTVLAGLSSALPASVIRLTESSVFLNVLGVDSML